MAKWHYECPGCSHEHVIEVHYERGDGFPAPGGYVFTSDPPAKCEDAECGISLPAEDALLEHMNESLMSRD